MIKDRHLFLLGVAFRVPAKFEDRYDDSHCQATEEDNKYATCWFVRREEKEGPNKTTIDRYYLWLTIRKRE